jgi:hypothetical protein
VDVTANNEGSSISFCSQKVSHQSLTWGKTLRSDDQGIKFCSIFKVLRMRRKQCHCVRLSSDWYIYFLKQSPYGEDIAICSPSQTGKNLLLTVPVRTVYGDVAGPYSPYGDVSGG